MLSPRTAALFTGRALVENSEPVPETKTLVQAVTEQALARKEAAHNMEMGDLMEQLVRQRRTIEEMQAQVDLVTGRCTEFERAAIDNNVGEHTQNQTMAVVEEFRRIREMEEPRELLPRQGDQGRVGERGQQPENRGAAFPFPLGDPGAEEQGGPRDGLRGLSLEPRSASGTVVLKKASFEMLRPSVAGSTGNPAIEDYVVTRLDNSLVRRDRRDFEQQGFRDQGCLDNEAKLWDQWSQSAPRVLWLKAGGTKPGAEMALRMSRAHAARKLPFLIEAGTGRPATKVLQSACQSSASYLLFRKQGMITNFPDSLKYDFAHAPPGALQGIVQKRGAVQVDSFPVDVQSELQSPELAEEEELQPETAIRVPTADEKESLGKLHRNLAGAAAWRWKWSPQRFPSSRGRQECLRQRDQGRSAGRGQVHGLRGCHCS